MSSSLSYLTKRPFSFTNKFNATKQTFRKYFFDNCQIYKKNNNDLCDAILPASEFKLQSARETITKPYFSIIEKCQQDNSEKNQWMQNMTDTIIENGNYLQLFNNLEVNAIGDDAFNDVNEIVSSEVRVREFICRQYSGIGTRPQKVQATFMTSGAMLLAQNVAGISEWREIGPAICDELGWSMKNTLSYRYLLCEGPRRVGKTRNISMGAVNYALSRPGSTIIVFSTSQDASDLLRTDVDNMMEEAGEMEFAGKMYKLTDLKVNKGKRKLTLRSPYDMSKLSTIYFKPGLQLHNLDKQVCYFLIFFA